MRRVFVLLAALLFLAACAEDVEPGAINHAHTNSAEEFDGLRVAASIFPSYDFVRQIAGERVELTLLVPPGMDTHAFEPTAQDILYIYTVDLLIAVGGVGERWVDTVLASLSRDDMAVVALLDLVEGIEAERHFNQGDGLLQLPLRDYGALGVDEHVWTSPRNAILIVQELAETLSRLDPRNAAYFQENAAAYIKELEALDRAFQEVVDQGLRSTVIFGDRFPFRYLIHAYALTYYAAFPGCATETEPSAATIAYLINKINAENIPVVFFIEFSNQRIADVIAEGTNARTLKLHSAHNVSHADYAAGVTYLELMWRNVEHLREALH